MSSIFGQPIDQTILATTGTTFLTGSTSISQSLAILDEQLTITNGGNIPTTTPLNVVVNNIANDVAAIDSSLSGGVDTRLTDLETDVGTLQTDVTAIETDLATNYRTSADEDLINATKLNISDFLSTELLHPTSVPTFNGLATCGYSETGHSKSAGTDTTTWANYPSTAYAFDPYDITNSGIWWNGSSWIGFLDRSNTECLIKETNGVGVNITKATVFGAQTNNLYVGNLAVSTDGTRLYATANQPNSSCVAWTDDGIAWSQYVLPSTNIRIWSMLPTATHLYVCYEAGLYKIANDFSSVSTITTQPNVNSMVPFGANFVLVADAGIFIWDGNTTFTPATTTGILAVTPGTYGYSRMVSCFGKFFIINKPAEDNLLWHSTDGLVWTSITMTAFSYLMCVYYSPSLDKLIVSGESTTTSKIAIIDNALAVTIQNVPNNVQDGNLYQISYVFDRFTAAGGSPIIPITLDAGVTNTTNVYDGLVALSTANDEIRAMPPTGVTMTDVNNAISASQSTQDGTIASTYYLQTNPAGYQTAANVTTALTPYRTSANQDIIDGNHLTSATAASTYLTQVSAASTYTSLSIFNQYMGYLVDTRANMLLVSIDGVTSPTLPNHQPYNLTGAIAAATSGDVILLAPGTYNITATLVIPAGVSLAGVDRNKCKIQANPVANFTGITLSNSDVSIRNLTLEILTTTAIDATAINITNTTGLNIDACDIIVNSSGAGSHNNIGILVNTTTVLDDAVINLRNSGVKIDSISTGNNYAISISNTGGFNCDNNQITSIRTSGAGVNFIGVQSTSAVCVLTDSFIKATTNDIAGANIKIGKSTVLANFTTNGIAPVFFNDTYISPSSNDGTLNAGTSYVYNTGVWNGNERQFLIGRKCIIYGLQYTNRLSTSSDDTTITMRKNGVNTGLTATMGAASLSGTGNNVAVVFDVGDKWSISIVRGTGTITDTNVSFYMY